MNRILEVCLVALALMGDAAPHAIAQSPALQKGVRVQLAVSANAAPMPGADDENAFIVTVAENGTVYLGVNRITLPDLKEKIRITPFQPGQKLYVKADARTPYARVLEVLDATYTGGIATQVLLTARTESSTPGAIASPEGVEVQLGPPLQNPR